jgi:F-type H+-transporting ATPase subunit gamma
MASLQALKSRIRSIKSNEKITKAMKMVAASKLRRACEAAAGAKPYTSGIEGMVRTIAGKLNDGVMGLDLLSGNGRDNTHLLVIISSDRGLCGSFNSSIIRKSLAKIKELRAANKNVKLICVGRKASDYFASDYSSIIVKSFVGLCSKGVTFAQASEVASLVLQMYNSGEFDYCHLFYNRFVSAISQVPTGQQIIPLAVNIETDAKSTADGSIEYEPEMNELLGLLLPKNIEVQVYYSLLQSYASEQGARMAAMDNASKNCADMLKRLQLSYNRTRQSLITKELIEIISGAEAV